MQIQINIGPGIDGKATLERWADEHLRQQLGRFADTLVFVDVHLSDENAARAGAADKRCTLNARLAGAGMVTAQGDAANIDQAIRSALDKLVRAISSQVEKAADHRDRASIRKATADLGS